MKKALFFILMLAVTFSAVFAQAAEEEKEDGVLPEDASLVAQAAEEEKEDGVLPEDASLAQIG